MLQRKKECLICKTTLNLQCHHVYEGTYRKASDRYGLTVWLCMKHHTGEEGIHHNSKLDRQLKAKAQKAFEKKYGHELFMRTFGINYIKEQNNG